MSINRAILTGYVGATPEIRRTQAGDPIANFRLATSETWKDKTTGERKESTEWHTIVCFNEALCRIIEEHVDKGSQVGVEGSIKTRKWTDKDGNDRWSTEIVIGRFDGKLHLIHKPGSGGGQRDEHGYGQTRSRDTGNGGAAAGAGGHSGAGGYGGAPGYGSAAGGPASALDDDIPF